MFNPSLRETELASIDKMVKWNSVVLSNMFRVHLKSGWGVEGELGVGEAKHDVNPEPFSGKTGTNLCLSLFSYTFNCSWKR